MSSANARLIEKDVMEDLSPGASGDSSIVDLNGATKFSCQAVYDVQSPSAKTFDDGVSSSLIVQDLTYTAVVRGVDGDDITIQYVGDGVAGAETVDVTDLAIVVHMDATVIIGSTADDILAAIEASIEASALVGVAVSGTGSTVQAVAAETPLAGGVDSEVDVVENTLALDASAMTLGLKVRLTTTGTLPAGLATGTDYFVIKVSDSLIQLASSLAHALAGTAVNITGQGSSGGVGTVTAVALSGASVTFEKSNSRSGPWVAIQAATSIAADGSVLLEQPDVSYRYFKVAKALTAGQVAIECNVLVIGPAV
jgi:hypothetical protein